MTLAAFGKSSQPLPSRQGLQCRTATPQVHPQGLSLATARLQSMAVLPQQDCPLLVGPGDCLWHCSSSPPASPISVFTCSDRSRALLCWFPKEMGACLVISSPSRHGCWHASFWGPRSSRSRHCGGLCTWQGCSRCPALTHCAQTAQSTSSPSPSRFGGQEAAEDNLQGVLGA